MVEREAISRQQFDNRHCFRKYEWPGQEGWNMEEDPTQVQVTSLQILSVCYSLLTLGSNSSHETERREESRSANAEGPPQFSFAKAPTWQEAEWMTQLRH
jgi:hypothetical protein